MVDPGEALPVTGPIATASKIADHCAELQAVAEAAGFTFLAYLLETARQEAVARANDRPRSGH